MLFLQHRNNLHADFGTLFVVGIFLIRLCGIAFQIGHAVNHADKEINVHFGKGFVTVQNQINEA